MFVAMFVVVVVIMVVVVLLSLQMKVAQHFLAVPTLYGALHILY